MAIRLIHIEETDSTNRWLKEHQPPFGPDEDIAVWADYQTAGRGCGTNTWESERKKNLLFSLLLHPIDVPATCQFLLSMANALALKDTLDDYAGGIKIKWPNDIYWNDRKIGGTLIETTLLGSHIKECIIGTGINVNQRVFRSDAPNPVSLLQILGHEADCQELLHKVMGNMVKYMDMVRTGAWEEIRRRYRSNLYRLQETHLYRLADGTEKLCKLVNVTDDGHLELLHDNGVTCRFAFKEVQFII